MRRDAIALTPAQRQIWLVSSLAPTSNAYMNTFHYSVHGAFDTKAFSASLEVVAGRHPVLHSRVVSTDEGPALEPTSPAAVTLEVREVDGLESARTLADSFGRTPRPIGEGALLRALALRISPEWHVVSLTIHHLAADGHGVHLLLEELSEAYSSRRDSATGENDPNVPTTRRDQGTVVRHLDNWKGRMEGFQCPELWPDHPRADRALGPGASIHFDIPADIHRELIAVGRGAGCTEFVTLLTPLHVALSRWCLSNDVAVGIPFSRNPHPTRIGHDVTTLTLRIRIDPQETFEGLLRKVRAEVLGAMANSSPSFEEVVNHVQPPRSSSGNPLFQVMFSIDDNRRDLTLDECVVERMAAAEGDAMLDLSVILERDGDRLRGRMQYAADLFDRETIESFARTYLELLRRLAAEPGVPHGEFDTGDGFASASAPLPEPASPTSIVALVGDRMRERPERIALCSDGGEVTFGELDRRSASIARALLANGVGLETRVGVMGDRSPDLVTAIVGIVRAGAVYVPIDGRNLGQQFRHIVEDANITTVVGVGEVLPEIEGPRVLRFDELVAAGEATSDFALPSTIHEDSLLYVLFTSGSTGRPKGVLVPHRGMVNRVRWAQRDHFSEDDRVLLKTALTFDAAGWELWAPLCLGIPLVVAPQGAEADPDLLLSTIRRHEVTAVQVVPSLLRLLTSSPELKTCSSLRTVFSGGEPLDPRSAQSLREALAVRLINLYGPTECTIDATSWEWRGDRSVSIGTPLPGCAARVCLPWGGNAAVNAPGELWITGPGVARGYAHQPGMTARQFVPDPLTPGARAYRTGDLARMRDDGLLDYLGRTDHQVKVGGIRTELGEIENAVSSHPDVTGCAVTAETIDGRTALIAHFEPTAIHVDSLRDACRARLARPLVPSQFIAYARLPRTTGGKVDRTRLERRTDQERIASDDLTPTERAVAEIIASRNPGHDLRRETNFFAAGGHSLAALEVAADLRSHLDLETPARLVFSCPTIGELAVWVDHNRRSSLLQELPPATSPAPATSGQTRIWLASEMLGQSARYRIVLWLKLGGAVDLHHLATSTETVLSLHPAMRTTLHYRGGALSQRSGTADRVTTPVEECRDWAAVMGRASAQTQAKLDLETGPVVRSAVYTDGREHLLALVLHHVVADGQSVRTIMRGIARCYAGGQLEAPTVELSQLAILEQDWLKSPDSERERAFWRATLHGRPSFRLPRIQEAVEPEAPLRTVRDPLPEAPTRRLLEIGRVEGCTPFESFATIVCSALARLTGQPEVTFATTAQGRSQAATEGVVGPLLNTVIVSATVGPEPDLVRQLRHVRDHVRLALEHQQLPFERVVECVNPPRESHRQPFTDVLFEVDDPTGPALALPGVTVEELTPPVPAAKQALCLRVRPTSAGYEMVTEHDRTLVSDHTADAARAAFVEELHDAIADPDTHRHERPAKEAHHP